VFTDPETLAGNLDRLEGIEKGSLRLVTQAVYDFRDTALEIFRREKDLAADIGEDITREALDRMGVSKIDVRLFGKIDYKRARYVFNRDYAIRQALFVDSKAEKLTGAATATLQTAQVSMRMRHVRAGLDVDEAGKLPIVIGEAGKRLLTTTIFVKYSYEVLAAENRLRQVTVAALPNGMLQDRYNPTARETIWRTGRNAPSLEEPFRVRLVFSRLKARQGWRVQHIPMSPEPFVWDD
jgi:Type II restriction enzyme SfiI